MRPLSRRGRRGTREPPKVALLGLLVGSVSVTGCGASMSLGAPLAPTTLDPPRRRFATGSAALCAVRAPGELVCWGGSIGGGAMLARGGLTDVVEVAVGDHHVCALRATGEVLCFGDDEEGQLGDPTRPATRSQELVSVPGLPRVERIAAYGDVTCAVTATGDVHCFGKVRDLVEGAPRRPPPTLVPGVSGVSQLSLGPRIACAVRRDGTALCWGGSGNHVAREELAGVDDALEIATSGVLRCVRSRPISRGGSGAVRCTTHSSPTQVSLRSPAGRPAPPITARDATALAVDWATACVLREGGDVECAGESSAARRGLSDLDGSDAIVLVLEDIGCGIDRRGGVRTKSNAEGFCGERAVVQDGLGRDPSRGGGSSYSADLAPGLRLGSSWLSGAGHERDGRFTSGLHVPLLFGNDLRAGPFVDLGTRGFSTAEPSAGLGLLGGAGLFLAGLDAGLGHAFAPSSDARSFAAFTARIGFGGRLDGTSCPSGCGLRYLTSAALEVSVRRSLTQGHPDDVGLFFSFDPAVLALPFAVLATDWSFR